MDKSVANRGTTLKKILTHCRQAGECLPAININDCYDLLAVVKAAENCNSDVIVMTYPPVVELIPPEIFVGMVNALRSQTTQQVFLHLDHCVSPEVCQRAIDAGYDSVMIDGSQLPLSENIRLTRQIVDYAHTRGVVVEAEIGHILGRGSKAKSPEEYLARVEDVQLLYEETKVDMIAVGIGTAHGFTPERPQIHFERLKEIAASTPVPLVLHGGTGIPDTDLHQAIRLGICKINFGTIVHAHYMRTLADRLQAAGASAYPPYVMAEVIPEVVKIVEDRIRAIRCF